jgi:putative redox protein
VSGRTATARWQPGPLRCDVEIDGFDVSVDEPVADGGTGEAPGPTGLLLTSVASCFALSLAFTAGRQGLAPSAIRVTVTGQYDGLRFGRIEVVSDVGGLTVDEAADLVVRAQRVCYVTNTLAHPPEIVFSTPGQPAAAG